MRSKITLRDVKFFLLGIASMFLFATIYDWDENVAAMKAGFEAGTTDWKADTE